MATETQPPPSTTDTKTSLKGHDATGQAGICPDPSAHQTKNTFLQDHASAAALYCTRPGKSAAAGSDGNILGADGKLSSASAATSLKYAQAHELPGFPIVGIEAHSSAGTAAILANANKKSPEWWKPEQSAAAGKAALLANDYKMAPVWQPEASAAGSKAALLAHKGGSNINLWTPEASLHGHSAANIAMKTPRPVQDTSTATSERRNKALLAATGAVSSSVGRRRAQSSPIAPPIYPDSHNSAKNALSAAKLAHSPSMKATNAHALPFVTDSNRLGSGAMEAARIQHSKSIAREMYTEHPPIALEVEEKQHQDALRASAISMAKKMYDIQQTQIEQAASRSSMSPARTGANAAHGQQSGSTDADLKEQALRYIGVQEAAQKLAAERLAKIGPDENAAFRSYYGYDKSTRNRLSIRRGRNRAVSNPETVDSDDDDFRSRRIRSQMSQFNKTLAEIDAQKREKDRRSLMAAAERKVQARMLGIDKKIFDETGKMSPAMVEDWDAKARAKAAAASEARMENHGRVHIGHGKYMDQAEIDAVAQARIQPTLDEIAEKTEKRRAEEEERRLDLEQKKREQQKEKQRVAELKAEEKRIKDEEKRAAKARTAQEKSALKMEKEAKKEKRASRGAAKDAVVAPSDEAEPATAATATEDGVEHDDLYVDDATAAGQAGHASEPEGEPTTPSSPKFDSKALKSFLNKFKRRPKSATTAEGEKQPGFIGGAALHRPGSPRTLSNQHSVPTSPNPDIHSSGRRYSDVSSLSSGRGRAPERTATGLSTVSADADHEEAKDDFDERLAPPPNYTTTDAQVGRKGSPSRDSKFHEIGI